MKLRYVVPVMVGVFVSGAVAMDIFGAKVAKKIHEHLLKAEAWNVQRDLETMEKFKAVLKTEDVENLPLPGDPNFSRADVKTLLAKAGIPESDFTAMISRRFVKEMGGARPSGRWNKFVEEKLFGTDVEDDELDEEPDDDGEAPKLVKCLQCTLPVIYCAGHPDSSAA